MAEPIDMINVGPWGGDGGVTWTFTTDGRITEINIASGASVDSIRFTYTDCQGTQNYSPTYGGQGGTNHLITIDEDEELNEMGGTIGRYIGGITVVRSLYFRTNKNTYGPFGIGGGTSFSLPVASGRFVGFFGKYGDYVNAIGAILQA